MKKLKEKKTTAFLVGMILGIIIAAATSAGAAILYQSSQVSYSNSSSGLSSTNVQGAIDELKTKIDNYDNDWWSFVYDSDLMQDNLLHASRNGCCVRLSNNFVHCVKINNFNNERNWMNNYDGIENDNNQFSNNQIIKSGYIDSSSLNYIFELYSNGDVTCSNKYETCKVFSNGSITCTDL